MLSTSATMCSWSRKSWPYQRRRKSAIRPADGARSGMVGSRSWVTLVTGSSLTGRLVMREVFALPFDDVIGVERGVGAGSGGDASADQVNVLGLQPGPEVTGPDVDDVQLDLAAGEYRLDHRPDLGEELDGELCGGHGDDGAEAAAAFGDPGKPVAEHPRRYLGGHLAGRGEQVVLAASLLDDDGLAAGRLEGPVERVELLADGRELAAEQDCGVQRGAGLPHGKQGAQ